MMRPRIPVWQRRLMRPEFNQGQSGGPWTQGGNDSAPRGPSPRGLLDTPTRMPPHARTPYDRPAAPGQSQGGGSEDLSDTQKQLLGMIDLAQKHLEMEREKILQQVQGKPNGPGDSAGPGGPAGPGGTAGPGGPGLLGQRPDGPPGAGRGPMGPNDKPGLLGQRPDQTPGGPGMNADTGSRMNGVRPPANGPQPLMGVRLPGSGPGPQNAPGPRGGPGMGPRGMIGGMDNMGGPRPPMGRMDNMAGPRGPGPNARQLGPGMMGPGPGPRQPDKMMDALESRRPGLGPSGPMSGSRGSGLNGPLSGGSGPLSGGRSGMTGSRGMSGSSTGMRDSLLSRPGLSSSSLDRSSDWRSRPLDPPLTRSTDDWRSRPLDPPLSRSTGSDDWRSRPLDPPLRRSTDLDSFSSFARDRPSFDSRSGFDSLGSSNSFRPRLGDRDFDRGSYMDPYPYDRRMDDRIEDRRFQPLDPVDTAYPRTRPGPRDFY